MTYSPKPETYRGFKIVAGMYDDDGDWREGRLADIASIEYLVREVATGRVIVDCIPTYREADQERDAYLAAEDAFIAGPFSDAQCRRR